MAPCSARLVGCLVLATLVAGSSCSYEPAPLPKPQPGGSTALPQPPRSPAPAQKSGSSTAQRAEVPPSKPQPKPAPEKKEPEFTALDLPDLPPGPYAVVLFPDGTMAAACGQDGKIQVYSVPSKEVAASFEGFAGEPRLAVSADGKLVAQGSDQETQVKVWNIEKRQPLKVLKGHKLPVSCLAFSPDGLKLATSSRSRDPGTDGEIKIWSLKDDSQPLCLESTSGISSITFSPDGNYLASGGVGRQSDDQKLPGEARVWDLKTLRATTTLTSKVGPVYQVAFSPDGKMLAFSERNGPSPLQVAHRIRLVDPLTGEEKGILLGHADEIHGLAFSPDGRFLVSVGRDRLMRIWQVATRSLRTVRDVGHYREGQVSFSRGGDRLAVAACGEAGKSRGTVWGFEHALQGEPSYPGSKPLRARVLRGRPTPVLVSDLAFSADGQSFLVCGSAAGTRIYDLASGKGRRVMTETPLPPQAFSPDLTKALVWDNVWRPARPGERSLLIGPDGKMTFNESARLKLWDLDAARMASDLHEPASFLTEVGPVETVRAPVFSPDGRSVAYLHRDGSIRVRELPGGRLSAVAFPPEGRPVHAAFSADGTKLATAGGSLSFVPGPVNTNGQISIWNMTKMEDPKPWLLTNLFETIQQAGSPDAKAFLAKAGREYRTGKKPAELAESFQTAASQLVEIHPFTRPAEVRWQKVTLNAAGSGVDAVRFKLPGSGPADLMWRVAYTSQLRECGVLPATGDLPDPTERFVYVKVDEMSTRDTYRVWVARVLQSPAIQAGKDYILWFAFASDRPVPVMVAVCSIPRGASSARGWGWPPYNAPELAGVPTFRRTRLFFHGDKLAGLALSSDGGMAASAGEDGLIKIWDVGKEKVVATCSGYLPQFSPDGTMLATAGNGEDAASVILWDPKTGSKLRTLAGGHFLGVSALAFSRDGKRLASGGRDGMVALWDTQTGKQAWTPAR